MRRIDGECACSSAISLLADSSKFELNPDATSLPPPHAINERKLMSYVLES